MSSSRIPGFYRLNLTDRRRRLAELCGLDPSRLDCLDHGGLTPEVADRMIENAVGCFALPFGIALNFVVDGDDVVVPMAIEEPSVVAAASNAARMVRDGGGFVTTVSPPIMIGQVQLVDVPDTDAAKQALERARPALIERARSLVPGLVERGGGPTDLEIRVLSEPGSPDGGMLIVHLLVDCRDAMGANMVNTVAEGIADELAEHAGARVGLRILSNLNVHRKVHVTARVPESALGASSGGQSVRDGIVAASRFAELDPYRAATHNKGIMNGIDAVLLATANDWRGVEAGAHAYACQSGRYRPLATWRGEQDSLIGELCMPLACGTVGGAIPVHAGAALALDILGTRSAERMAAIVGAAGLATNLAALRALATVGIQRGHMSLHARKEQPSLDSEPGLPRQKEQR